MQERATPSPYIVPKTLIEGVIFICYTHRRRGVAQPGSAPAWGAGGRWFESNRPDHLRGIKSPRYKLLKDFLNIKQYMHDITVFQNVLFSFLSYQTFLFCFH